MKIVLIITTYNWVEALDLVLDSVSKQTLMPDEIVIADDGSEEETKKIIDYWRSRLPIELIHSWQEDKGFRLSESRNKAILKSSSDYVVMIDGDMILDKRFIEDHKRISRDGYFVQGNRIKLKHSECISVMNIDSFNIFSPYIKDTKNRLYAIRSPFLSLFCKGSVDSKSGIKGCNIGFWRKDALKINGFNNEFIGWGYEDVDFTLRMINSGIKRQKLKLSAIAYHLFHQERSRCNWRKNRELMTSLSDGQYYCRNGIISHIDSSNED
ncbi:glycosyl transferase family 2 [Vibrio inusitatus NBRC 102082]|uniref:Glycosyl transferase family 2 n=1 Tax=Vibrio inusitatus NBRC 102082 TaxID=1219070 RepID=A0A4Y3HW28_9VIBR|nr:glycosyltransferase family 2 protein [Vibrio inusitatus]GEA51316.1 glycosyl transferase family 2 [Vibrio inusitatus NBRC 102082]